MSDRTPTPTGVAADLAGFPFERLRFDHNPALPLALELSAADLKAQGVASFRAFTATRPAVWLLVFEFSGEPELFAALEDPSRLIPRGPPHHTAVAFTGRWLLVTGFPSDKPVSPEMEAARIIFLARWAGEE